MEAEPPSGNESEVIVCDTCGDAGDTHLLAICSNCESGAEHSYCMRVMRNELPDSSWVCEDCANEKKCVRPGIRWVPESNKSACNASEEVMKSAFQVGSPSQTDSMQVDGIATPTVIEADSIAQGEETPMPETPAIPDPIGHREESRPLSTSAVPVFRKWGCDFVFLHTAQVIHGIQACLSSKAGQSVHETVQNFFSGKLLLEVYPVKYALPLAFQEHRPQRVDGLYFFPAKKEASSANYEMLLKNMTEKGLALFAIISWDIGLYIFSSKLLPEESQHWGESLYLWGAFVCRCESCPQCLKGRRILSSA